jgi:hypothetical protein
MTKRIVPLGGMLTIALHDFVRSDMTVGELFDNKPIKIYVLKQDEDGVTLGITASKTELDITVERKPKSEYRGPWYGLRVYFEKYPCKKLDTEN